MRLRLPPRIPIKMTTSPSEERNMDVKQIALEKVVKMLDNIGVQYAVIGFDGKKHGTLEVAPPKPERTRTKYEEPHGELTEYVRGYISEMKPGDVIEVPMKYGRRRTQSALSGYACRIFGNGNTVTSYNMSKDVLEIMRIL
jgi:hypothetical protein